MKKVAIEHADSYRLETVKEALRSCFLDLGYPINNPLSGFIHPGDKVFIKPNWVASRWRESCPHKDNLLLILRN